ncbi:MAG: hypothetical protein ACXW4P_01075 [Thermoanaerobaculia bacterium]
MMSRFAAVAAAAWALQFTWEMAQGGLFVEMQDLPFWTATRWCAGAAAWDLVIVATAYCVAALTVRDSWWMLRPFAFAPLFVFLTTGLVITILIEMWAVRTGHWTYAATMPLVAGVGVAPLAQWVVIPLLIVFVARRLLSRGHGRDASPSG